MMSKQNLNYLGNWVNQVSVYPPSEIYYCAPKKLEKEERKVKVVCEELYRFNWEGANKPNPIGNLREIYREMAVLDRMFEDGPCAPKYEYITKLVAKFLLSTYHLHVALGEMHNKHNKLKSWYGEWSVGQLQLMLNAQNWGTGILRLPKDDRVLTKFIDDISHEQFKLQEMTK